MTLPTEAVTLAGSGLVFINDYSDSVSADYRSAIISAENFLQSHFTNQLTVSVNFDFAPLSAGSSAENNFDEKSVSYAQFVAALRTHATTADDLLSVNGLPASDPSGGAGFAIPTAEAVMLGLAKQSNNIVDSVTLNSNLNFTFGQDAIGAVEHELSEGVFGRIAAEGVEERLAAVVVADRVVDRDFAAAEDSLELGVLGRVAMVHQIAGRDDRDGPGPQLVNRPQHLAQTLFIAQLVQRILTCRDMQVCDLRDG